MVVDRLAIVAHGNGRLSTTSLSLSDIDISMLYRFLFLTVLFACSSVQVDEDTSHVDAKTSDARELQWSCLDRCFIPGMPWASQRHIDVGDSHVTLYRTPSIDGYRVPIRNNGGVIDIAGVVHRFEFELDAGTGCARWQCLPLPSSEELEAYPDNPSGQCRWCYSTLD